MKDLKRRLNEGDVIRVVSSTDNLIMSFYKVSESFIIELYKCKLEKGNKCTIRFPFVTKEAKNMGCIYISNVNVVDVEDFYDIIDNLGNISINDSNGEVYKKLLKGINKNTVSRYWDNIELHKDTDSNYMEFIKGTLGQFFMFNSVNDFLSMIKMGVFVESEEDTYEIYEDLYSDNEESNKIEGKCNSEDAKMYLLDNKIMSRASNSMILGNVIYNEISRDIAYPIFNIVHSRDSLKMAIYLPVKSNSGNLIFRSIIFENLSDSGILDEFHEGIHNVYLKANKISNKSDKELLDIVFEGLGDRFKKYSDSVKIGNLYMALNKGFTISSVSLDDM